LKHGIGEYSWTDAQREGGGRYIGKWENNRISGFGSYFWGDGRRYEGEWVLNKMQGVGRYTWPD